MIKCKQPYFRIWWNIDDTTCFTIKS